MRAPTLLDSLAVLEGHPTPHALVEPGGRLRWASASWRQMLDAVDWEGSFGVRWSGLERPEVLVRPDGSRFKVCPVFASGDGGVLVEAREVTLEVQRLEALEASEQSFRGMAENVPGALFRYLELPDGTNRVEYMSPRCLELWEVPAETVMKDASPLWGMVHPDDLPAMVESVKASARTLEPWFHEWRITTPSGKAKWLQGAGRPVRRPDGGVLWNSFILDVTDRKRAEARQRALEAELARTQRLEFLGRLAGSVAHDFNNFLTVILTATQSLHDSAPADSAERQVLSEVLLAAGRSAELTRQLLPFGRRQPAAPRLIDPGAQLEALEPLLRRVMPAAVQLALRLERTPRVFVDPTRFDQLVTNLVLNARDAVGSSGVVEVRLLAADHDGRPGARLEVADDGVGIDEAAREKLFEPFFTTKAPGVGTGLGLSIVRSVVDEAGGHVTFTSAPGQGTTFAVWFPEAVVRDVAAPATLGPLKGPILIVEDDAQLRRQVARLLEGAGVVVTTAASADEALGLPDLSSFRVALIDVVLGPANGVELVTELQQRGLNCPVVHTTGYVRDEVVRELLESSGRTVLPKPFNGPQVLEVLGRLVEPAEPAWVSPTPVEADPPPDVPHASG